MSRAHGHDLADVDLRRPVPLKPCFVEKPWGREIWFSGIEERGESSVLVGERELPLSAYLSLAPEDLCDARELLLLKILDPRPEPELGDLYFEVHTRKQEVYVVTHVDRESWPGGRGAIRLGMSQARRRQYPHDDAFRSAYLAAVRAYERIRRRIDAGERVDPELEAAARTEMYDYTSLRPLTVGDVVVIPTWLPHALQHGVRVVEFQTPTYERLIISFAQRVLTQSHWDSAEAVRRMRLDAPPAPELQEVAKGVQRICRFDDFGAWRIELAPGESVGLPAHLPYAIAIGIVGQTQLGDLALGPEQAGFLPRSASHRLVSNAGDGSAVCIVAAPGL